MTVTLDGRDEFTRREHAMLEKIADHATKIVQLKSDVLLLQAENADLKRRMDAMLDSNGTMIGAEVDDAGV